VIYEWDSGKAADNEQKHGVSFKEAITVFLDPLATLSTIQIILQVSAGLLRSAHLRINGCFSLHMRTSTKIESE